jgi:hypothetical protein
MTGGNSYNTWVDTFIQSQIAAGNLQLTYTTYLYHSNPWQISEVQSQIITGDTSSSDDTMYQVQFGTLQTIGGGGYFSLSSATEDFPDDSFLLAANNGPQQPQQPQQPQPSRLNQASKAALHTLVFGQAIGTGVGCGVGALVAAGATAATETYPLAGATVPAGCIGGGIIGFFDALPYSTLGAIADFGWTYWGH